jgi:hypothetical protein
VRNDIQNGKTGKVNVFKIYIYNNCMVYQVIEDLNESRGGPFRQITGNDERFIHDIGRPQLLEDVYLALTDRNAIPALIRKVNSRNYLR